MWVDLTQPFQDAAGRAGLPAPTFETLRDVEEDGVNAQRYGAPTHVGTHVDAPRHFVPGGATIEELPLDRFAGEAVVLDATRDEPGTVDAAELAAAADDGPGVEAGDAVLVATGWDGRYGTADYERYPWLSADAADWLLDRDVRLLGVDTPSPDRPRALRPDGWDDYPLHRRLLGANVPIVEQLRGLASLAGRRVELYAFPLSLRGGDGAPCRAVARMPPTREGRRPTSGRRRDRRRGGPRPRGGSGRGGWGT